MSTKRVNGVWVIVCDWVDPNTGESCNLGYEGEPRMAVDPDGGKSPSSHYQCGAHHGIVKQAEKPEFQLPEGHKLNEEVLKRGIEGEGVTVEEVEDD